MDKVHLKKLNLNDRLLRSWIRCERKAWLDCHEDSQERIWSAHRALLLDHQQKSLADFLPDKAERGISACEKGAKSITGIRLKGILPNGVSIESHPPLLQRIKGKSKWGDFAYRPIEVRQGKRISRSNRLLLSLNGLLLEETQNAKVTEGVAICKTEAKLEINLIYLTNKLKKQLYESLSKLEDDINKTVPPPLTADRRKCTLCSWRKICGKEAEENGHISEVSGIGAKRKLILKEIGIKNLNDLASSNPLKLNKQLSYYGQEHSNISDQLISQAKSQFSGFHERIRFTEALPELISAPGVLIYDIESDPDKSHDFLHGFLRINKKENGEWDLLKIQYHPILNLNSEQSYLSWEKIKRKLNNHPNWPVLHYGETELIAISKLAKKHSVNSSIGEVFNNQFIDIHSRLKDHWRLPLSSYSLKKVAKWTGFNWRNSKADGARALLWWRQLKYEEEKALSSKHFLQWILEYNEDDCRATWRTAQWLLIEDKKVKSSNTS